MSLDSHRAQRLLQSLPALDEAGARLAPDTVTPHPPRVANRSETSPEAIERRWQLLPPAARTACAVLLPPRDAETPPTDTRHGRLEDVRLAIEGDHLYLHLDYSTGDAAGQNMVTLATAAVCGHLLLPKDSSSAAAATGQAPQREDRLRRAAKRTGGGLLSVLNG